MIDVNALNAAMNTLVDQKNILKSKLDELTTDVQKMLIDVVDTSSKQIADAVALVQAEIDMVAPPVPPTPAPEPAPTPAPDVPQG